MRLIRHTGLALAFACLISTSSRAQDDTTSTRVRYNINAQLPVEEHATPPLFLPLIEALQNDAHLRSLRLRSHIGYATDGGSARPRRNDGRIANLSAQYEFAGFGAFKKWYADSPIPALLEELRIEHNAQRLDVNLYLMRGPEPELNATLDEVY